MEAENEVPSRLSRQEEIRELVERLGELEKRMTRFGMGHSPPVQQEEFKEEFRIPKYDENIGRLYWKCGDDGNVEVLFVFCDDTVLF
jgi:hypothetical protein